MNNKIKTILFASLLVAMILPFSVMSMADATPNENANDKAKENTESAENAMDLTYFEQAVVMFQKTQELHERNIDDKSKVSSMKNESAQIGIQNAEKRIKDAQIRNLEKTISDRDQQINSKFAEIKALEVLNKKLYEVDDETKANLIAAEVLITEEYLNSDSPVVYVGAYFKDRNIKVIVSPTLLEEQNISQASLTSEISNLVSSANLNVEINVELGEMEKITCSSRSANCSTFLGGLSAAGDANNGLNTMGYKAKNGSVVGFVMAEHSIDGDETDVVQPYTSSTSDGTVKEVSGSLSNCDCAWIDSDKTVHNQIYKASNTAYTQNAKTSDSSQSAGTWVYKSGARTGVSLGEITVNPTASGAITLVTIYIGSGDSGSPVFTLSGNNANIYGMFIGANSGTPSYQNAYYQPQDFIASELDITTSTS